MGPDDIRTVAVIGAGLMGHGIALEFALAGLHVRVHDVSSEKLDDGRRSIQRSLSILTTAGLVTTEQADAAVRSLQLTTDIREIVPDVDLVVEAVLEDLDLKRSIFAQLDTLCPDRTILSSNTSTLMPSSIASATRRPDRVLVTHYFNPPYLLPLVEVVGGENTSDETVSTICQFLTNLGKRPVIVRKEVPGFIGNRLQMALVREALSLVEHGVATAEDVDAVIRFSFGRRLSAAGIFEIFDIAGWDLVRAIALNLLPSIESSSQVSPLLDRMVENGEVGVKAGKGFYSWTEESADGLRQRIASALIEIQRFQAKDESTRLQS
ncbi:MAG: 3-hydroxyacyl-CoA dehydrogenase family protein [Ignavibacteria bacterium]|nr:3-hydroxyacyl-CoA dehydrogenase family protein [Ignavibacteria bacterium]